MIWNRPPAFFLFSYSIIQFILYKLLCLDPLTLPPFVFSRSEMTWYLSHNILLSTAVSVLSILYLPVSLFLTLFPLRWKGPLRERRMTERERESKMVVGGVFFVTLQASKCSQVHSAPWERWRTLGTFVATGMWCTQFAHGNKVRVRRIYYHILSVDVSEAGYDHNMRIPGKFLQGRGDGFRIKTTKSLNSFSHWVDRVMSLSVNPARTWNEVKKLPGCARFNQSNHSRCGMRNHSLTARSIQIRAVTCLQASAGWLMESH